MSATIDDKKLDGAGLATLWGIIKQYIVDNPSIPKATASTLGCIMVGTTLGVNNSGVLNLASGVVTAGTYKSVTVDTYGRVTAGTNPNTLAGYGITDAKISNGSIILGENSITPITSLSGYATQTWVQQQGYLTEETYKGTVTQVKVGTTAYDPTSGVVSLPAYPTTLPASDVYSWAKAASKPSYTASEVGAATSGHTHTTNIATSSAENQLTLAFGTKYVLTAGGTSYVFTMPSNSNINTTYKFTIGSTTNGDATNGVDLGTLKSETAAASGTTLSLVTTGEKATWNAKSNLTIGTTATTAAAGNHTHTLSIATSSGTNALTLAANTKYVLTVGGSTFIFTTPTDTNTWRPLGTGASDACAGNDSRLSDSRPASDVYSWAKASSKPTYTASEVGAATSGHTHTTSIATSTGTNQITLAHGGKYAITAGGTSYIFTMPSDNNTTYSAGTGLSLSGTTFSLATSGVTAGTYKRVTVDAYGRVTSGDNTDANDNTWRNVYTGGTSRVGTGTDTKAINFVAGSNVSISYEAAGTGSGQSGNANYFNVKIAATDTTYSAATQSAAGLMSAADKTKLDGIASGANAYSLPTASSSTLGGVKVGTTLSISSSVLNLATSGVTAGTYKRVTVDSYGRVTSGDNTDANDNTWRGIYVKGTSSIGTGTDTKALNFAAGSNVSISFAAAGTGSGQSGNANYGTITINATDTTYSAATQSAAGLMSAADKKKLDGIASGANAYSLPAASTSALGGIKVNYTNSGKNYKVQLDSSNNAYVNVPWENTTYTIPTKVSQLTNDSGYITSYTNTWRNVYLAGTEKVGTGTGTKGLNFVAGSNVSITYEAAGTSSGQSGNANYFNIKIAATDTTYSAATQSANGLMSAADKKKLDGIAAGANAYSLPTASSSALGGIKVGASVSGKNYAVQLDSSNCAYVNVPWTDNNTTYTQASLGQVYAYSTPPTSGTAVTATNSDYILATGGILAVQFDTNPVPASATLNVNSKGAKNIKFKKAALAAGVIKAGDLATFMYDGTQYELLTVDRTMKAVTDISRNGTTFTATCVDGSTFTFTQQDNNTTYTLAGLMGSSAKGGTTQPIYWNGSAFANTTYTLGKSVPSDAVFTDTNTWRTVQCNGTSIGNNTLNLKAGTNISLSNSSGTITITATDTNTTYSAGTGISLSGTTFSNSGVRSTAINGNYLRVNTNGTNADLTIPFATNADYASAAGYSGYSNRVLGSYTNDGGQQNPNYFGVTRVGFLMMNTTVNGNSQYKDWVIMDCYGGNDAGGGVAIGVNRQSLGAYIMRSAAARTSWEEKAELCGTHNSSVSLSGSTLTVKIAGVEKSLTNTNTTYSASTGLSLSGTAFSINSTYQTYISHGESAYNSLGNYLPLSGGTLTSDLRINMSPQPVLLLQVDGETRAQYGYHESYGLFIYNYVQNYGICVNNNGNVIIGDLGTTPSYKLHIQGNCGATNFLQYSDIRKKNVIKNTDLRIEQIANAPSFEYRWNDTTIDTDLHVGTSAQYWESVLPEVVSRAKDAMGTLSMQYGVAALVSCISVAKETLTLKEKVALLETRVESLEKKIREYESN